MQDSLALLALVVAGRRLGVVTGSEPAAYTDGQVLWLPAGDPGVVATCAQAGFIAAGSLEPQIMARLLGRRSVAARYAVLEAARLAQILGHVLPPVAHRALSSLGVATIPASADHSLARAFSDEPITPAPEVVGVIKPSMVLFARATGRSDTAAAAREVPVDDVTGMVPEADDDVNSGVKDRLASVFSKNPLSKLLRDLLGSEMTSREQDENASEFAAGGAHRVREMGGAGEVVQLASIAEADDGHAVIGPTYPEWDDRRKRYRRAHCTVHHLEPGPGRSSAPTDHAPDHTLRRAIARVGLALEREGRLEDGDALDLRALVDFAVDRAAGLDADGHVYERRRATGRDLGVVIILDASGSTNDLRASGDAVWHEQRRLASRLTDAFERAGDRSAAYAFRSMGRRDVRFLRIKHFDDRFDHAVRRRLAEIEPTGYTRLGAAIRHGTSIARESSGAGRRLLVLISDGLPYEDDYQGRYAEADVRRSIEEAVASGVGCLCLSVGSAQEPEALERIWGKVNHLHLDNSAELAHRSELLIRAALRGANDASHGERRRTSTNRPILEMNHR